MRFNEMKKRLSILLLVFAALLLFGSNFASLVLTLKAENFLSYVPVVGGGFAFVFFAGTGLRLILKSLDREKFVSSRASNFLIGLLIYLLGALGSVVAGSHGIYWHLEFSKAENTDISRVLVSFASLTDQVQKHEAKAIADYSVRINSLINSAVDELRNRTRPGAGDQFQKNNELLQRALGGVVLQPLSGPVTEDVIAGYYTAAFKLRDQNVKSIRENVEAVKGFVSSSEVVDNLQVLSQFKDKPVRNDQADREIATRVAYSNYSHAQTLFTTMSKSLGVDVTDIKKLDSVPPSSRLSDISFFVKNLLSPGDDDVLVRDRALWSIFAAFVLELLFIVSMFSMPKDE